MNFKFKINAYFKWAWGYEIEPCSFYWRWKKLNSCLSLTKRKKIDVSLFRAFSVSISLREKRSRDGVCNHI